MLYLLLKFVHLTAAACFIGGVFFEVMILSRAARQLDEAPRAQLSRALGQRARQVMHWVVLALYGAGIGLAWHHRAALAQPFASSFGTLLTLKICLALSILGHFILVVLLMRSCGVAISTVTVMVPTAQTGVGTDWSQIRYWKLSVPKNSVSGV